MGFSAPPISLTWADQHSPTACRGLISSATQPNMAFSAALFSQTWTYQHSLTALHGLISTV